MNSKTIRRLASEHSQLHTKGLPPNFLWPSDTSLNDGSNLSELIVLLAGPESTPFSSGLFTLHLSIPDNYPSAAPKATFRTKIFHPNVSETGSVCVDTLKRDWKPELKIYDILVVINCLLISPNPSSALNAEAGRLCETDYLAFTRRAKTWVSIHATCPRDLLEAVEATRRRGEVEASHGHASATQASPTVSLRRPRRRRGEAVIEPLGHGTSNMLGISIACNASDKMSSSKAVLVDAEYALRDVVNPALPAQPIVHLPLPTKSAESPRDSLGVPAKQPVRPRTVHESPPLGSAQNANANDSIWLAWQHSSSPPRNEEANQLTKKRKRQELEQKSLKAARGCMKRYNSGDFGDKRGLGRL